MRIRLIAAYAVLLAALWLGVSHHYAIPPEPPLAGDERAEVAARMRAHLRGEPPYTSSAVATTWHGFASLWCGGQLAARVGIDSRPGRGVLPINGPDDASALSAGGVEPSRCRIKVDVVRGRGPISTIDPLLAMSLVPGVDGLGLDFDGRETLLLPDDLLHAEALAGRRPIPGVDFEMGLDTRAALRMLAQRAGTDGARWRATPHRLFRFRTESFIEPAQPGPPLPIFRGNPPGPPLDRAHLHAAALAGAEYLLAHLHDSDRGARFDYEYYTLTDQPSPEGGDYSLPRHAGAAYFLAQAFGASGDPRYAGGAARAIATLAAAHPSGCDTPEHACVGEATSDTVDLGTSALSLAAATEYQRATGDGRFEPWARRVAAFLLAMQKPNGDFSHLYHPARGARDERTELLYASGEAALGLAKLAHLVQGRPDSAQLSGALTASIDRALDFLTGENYGFFSGQFFYGEDHWTCIAVEAAWDLLPAGARRERYADFCEGFGRWLRRTQFAPGEAPLAVQPDLAGSYGFTPMMPPHPTPVGSRSEAMVSTWLLAQRRGHAVEAQALRAQLAASFRFLLDHQVRDDSAYLMPNPAAARGGFLMSDVKRSIRIDFVQHACSALLRGEGLPSE